MIAPSQILTRTYTGMKLLTGSLFRPNFGTRQIRSTSEIKSGMFFNFLINGKLDETMVVVRAPYQNTFTKKWLIDAMDGDRNCESYELKQCSVVPHPNGFFDKNCAMLIAEKQSF